MTATGEPERKKRTAERQITKDDPQEDDDDNEEETSTEEPCQDFPKADAETMKKRRIVKATFRPSLNQSKETEEETKTNPFASLAQKTGSVFGSGFSGGFGTAASNNNNNGGGFRFGSNGGFGSAAAGSGFQVAASQGANSSTASLFGSAFSGTAASTTSSLSESAFGSTTSASKATSLTETQFPEHVDLKTGEEDEEVVFQVRSKAFVLVEKEEPKPMPTEVEDGAIHSVPPSSSNTNAAAKEDTKESPSKETNAEQVSGEKSKESKVEDGSDKKESKVEKKEPEASDKEDQKPETNENGKPKEAPESKKKKDWQELGTGPLRILRRKDGSHTRVVQRRETMEGGAGTKLLINVPLSKESTVGRPSEKHVRLSTIEPSGTAATYLLKVKTKDEANALEKALEGEIGQAESLVET